MLRALPPTRSFRVLLIDDNPYGLVVRKAILEQAGYEVTAAGTPETGLASFLDGTWDVVITDYRMPGMTGAQVIERMRALQPGVPIILVSSVAEVLGLNQSNTGADVVIPKTANEGQHMLRAVARLLMPRKPAARHRHVAHAAGATAVAM
ncbi:MAG TPA: response regulator [Bryobacteraceae bacterium]|nr:response regulator [Bryobacteraceae bacterium]